jgi:hypothetical protein
MPDIRRVREEIARAQEEALEQLRQAQLTDQQYLVAQRRVISLCTRTLQLLDEAYLEVEGYLNNQNGCSEHHQRFLEERAAQLLRSLEHAIADITASAVTQVKRDLPNTRPREKVVKEVIVKEVEPTFLKVVRKQQDLCTCWGFCS